MVPPLTQVIEEGVLYSMCRCRISRTLEVHDRVTRGKQLVVVIGQPRALAIAVRNVRATQRLTNLAARLRQGKRAAQTREAS